MELLEILFEKMGADGMKHFIVSSVITALLHLFLVWWLALGITLLVGVAKELYDKHTKNGSAEWKDIVCDALGSLVVVL
jgi:hypothetical protein